MLIYCASHRATSLTHVQICEYGSRAIDIISPQKDTAQLAARIPRLMASATPKPVYYHNYTVGECRDLIFGVTLVDYATSRGLPEGEVPRIIKLCVREVETRGLDAEGIYRVSSCAIRISLMLTCSNDAGFRQTCICAGGMSCFNMFLSSILNGLYSFNTR